MVPTPDGQRHQASERPLGMRSDRGCEAHPQAMLGADAKVRANSTRRRSPPLNAAFGLLKFGQRNLQSLADSALPFCLGYAEQTKH